MRLIARGSVEPKEVPSDAEGNPARGTRIQVLVADGPNFAMRLFTIEPGGHTPLHSHPWEHEVYIVSGAGRTRGAMEAEISAGDAVYVPPGELHSFVNSGDGELSMICVVPAGAR